MPASASPFTSQGYPFSKDLRSYDAEGLGRAFFADGLMAALGCLHLYDAGGWLASAPTVLDAKLCLYQRLAPPIH